MFLCVIAYTYIYIYIYIVRKGERVIALKKTTYLNNIFDSSLPIIFIIYINLYISKYISKYISTNIYTNEQMSMYMKI